MPSAPRTVADIQSFITMLLVACENSDINAIAEKACKAIYQCRRER